MQEEKIIIAGVDEAGRGPLAGPVIAAAVILNPKNSIIGLADSKELTPKKRAELCLEIKEKSISWAIGRAEVSEIDDINILQASLLAMYRAIMALNCAPSIVLIDGNQIPRQLTYPAKAIIDGDATEPAISAASILAKVVRDREMEVWDKTYPEYGFLQHKGYGTKQHMAALKEHGACPIHRRSFAPVRAVLEVDEINT